MGTRSFIAIKNNDSTYDAVYCHWDGYEEGVGRTLKENYTNEDKIKELISKGAMATLGKDIGDCEFYSSRGEQIKVHRGLSAEELRKKAIHNWCEFLYKFENSEWSTTKL